VLFAWYGPFLLNFVVDLFCDVKLAVLERGGAKHFLELGISSFREMPNQKTEYSSRFTQYSGGENC
jgi:hypothetical protein